MDDFTKCKYTREEQRAMNDSPSPACKHFMARCKAYGKEPQIPSDELCLYYRRLFNNGLDGLWICDQEWSDDECDK